MTTSARRPSRRSHSRLGREAPRPLAFQDVRSLELRWSALYDRGLRKLEELIATWGWTEVAIDEAGVGSLFGPEVNVLTSLTVRRRNDAGLEKEGARSPEPNRALPRAQASGATLVRLSDGRSGREGGSPACMESGTFAEARYWAGDVGGERGRRSEGMGRLDEGRPGRPI
jgi:hypothetical protein